MSFEITRKHLFTKNAMCPSASVRILHNGATYRVDFDFDRYNQKVGISVFNLSGDFSEKYLPQVQNYAESLIDSIRAELVETYAKELASFKYR